MSEQKPDNAPKNKLQSKHLKRILITALIVAWGFDFLFWKRPLGINFPIFVLALLIGGLIMAYSEKVLPSRLSLLLILPILFFTSMTAVRLEPFTTFLNVSITLFLLAILAASFVGGRWPWYGIPDYFVRLILLFVDAFISLPEAWINQPNTEEQEADEGRNLQPIFAWLRGLLIALPVVLFFSALLSSADPIFARAITDFFDLFDLEDLAQYFFRGIYIIFLAYILAGLYLFAFYKSKKEKLVADGNGRKPSFLGFTEGSIVLGSVDLLFGAFVAIQFRYFFGGQANITNAGYTFAEYARRGFGELITVAVFSLLLFLLLNAITKRQSGSQRGWFSTLSILLVVLVGVMLVSAFQRLYLYEQVFGFTRLRTYSHVFMIWLGILLLAVVLLELMRRPRFFVLATLLASIGFSTTLNALNVDGFIARQNINRARLGESLDIPYLASLSTDAVPVLRNEFVVALNNGGNPQEVADDIGGAWACHAALHRDYDYERPWQGFHFSHLFAQTHWMSYGYVIEGQGLGTQLDEVNDWSQWSVTVNGEDVPCVDGYYFYR
ncbi:MAG: DUF4173 domain-containing protein [Chloroflexi bacterium]|nr:DUF4173 domain-containing protein [Chloroflexota bacterium]